MTRRKKPTSSTGRAGSPDAAAHAAPVPRKVLNWGRLAGPLEKAGGATNSLRGTVFQRLVLLLVLLLFPGAGLAVWLLGNPWLALAALGLAVFIDVALVRGYLRNVRSREAVVFGRRATARIQRKEETFLGFVRLYLAVEESGAPADESRAAVVLELPGPLQLPAADEALEVFVHRNSSAIVVVPQLQGIELE